MNPNTLRSHVLKMVYDKKSGHIGSSFSIAELISYLYSNYDLTSLQDPRDKLILSKGHAVPIIYAVLFELGLIANLNGFREVDSPLQGHPDKLKLPYIHATTGSLGQGLSIACGMSLSNQIKGYDNKVFCILGDGEIQEGQIWESFIFANKYKLNNLIAIVDWNKFQNDGPLFSFDDIKLCEIMTSMGWHVISINNGNDIQAIKIAFENYLSKDKPNFIMLKTLKGKGVSFMENNNAWHSKIPNQEEFLCALKELS